jgi:hypothetical protein
MLALEPGSAASYKTLKCNLTSALLVSLRVSAVRNLALCFDLRKRHLLVELGSRKYERCSVHRLVARIKMKQFLCAIGRRWKAVSLERGLIRCPEISTSHIERCQVHIQSLPVSIKPSMIYMAMTPPDLT